MDRESEETRNGVETVPVVAEHGSDGRTDAGFVVADSAEHFFRHEEPPMITRRRRELSEGAGSDRDSQASSTTSTTAKLKKIIGKARKRGKKLLHRNAANQHKEADGDIDCDSAVIDRKGRRCEDDDDGRSGGDDDDLQKLRCSRSGVRRIPFLRLRLAAALFMLLATVFLPWFLSGFLWGVYLSVVCFLYTFASKPIDVPSGKLTAEIRQQVQQRMETLPQTENTVVFRGWMNELKGRYDPLTYHVNMTQSVLVRLEGKTLHLSRPKRNIFRHSVHNDHSIRDADPTIVGESTYDLTNAQVSLRPRSLASRRWWVRKYPICIRLAPSSSNWVVADSDSHFSDSDSTDYESEASDEETIETNVGTRTLSSKSAGDILDVANTVEMKTDAARRGSRVTQQGKCIYLFVRSAREKERWFHRLRETCSQHQIATSADVEALANSGDSRRGSAMSLPTEAESVTRKVAHTAIDNEYFLYTLNAVQFARDMVEVLETTEKSMLNSDVIRMDLDLCPWTHDESPTDDSAHAEIIKVANAVGSRIFYDFCRDEYWISLVKERIQAKLQTLHLPYFIETLELTKLELGTTAPRIVGVHPAVLNDWGLWTAVDLKYGGGVRLTLATRVNLMKLKNGDDQAKRKTSRPNPLNITDDGKPSHYYSDAERRQSPESSPDEDFCKTTEDAESFRKIRSGNKMLKWMEKIVHTSVFQGVTDLKPVKKIMEDISSTPVILNVEVIGLEGTMAINFAPPPSDRFWYGFRQMPKLTLKAVPQVGDRAVEFSSVCDWIEKRLHTLIEKNLVVPNMDDIIIPTMAGNEMIKFGRYNK